MLLDERQINLLESLHVPNIYYKDKSYEYAYWFRSLLQKIDSSLIFTIPETWPEDFFKLCLWSLGYVCVFNSERFGFSFQPCTVGGFDFYYQPEYCIVSNPRFQKKLYLHKNAELIKLTPDFMGILDIIDFYATKLAELTKSIQMAIVNAKVPMVLTAANQAQAETLKSIYDHVQQGEPLVIWKDIETLDEIIPRKEPFEVFEQNLKQTYIGTELLDNLQTILDSFYMEIGLPVSLQKRAHILTEEAEFQSAQSQARIACWVANLNESFEKIENLFGEKLEVQYNADSENDLDRNRDGITDGRKVNI